VRVVIISPLDEVERCQRTPGGPPPGRMTRPAPGFGVPGGPSTGRKSRRRHWMKEARPP